MPFHHQQLGRVIDQCLFLRGRRWAVALLLAVLGPAVGAGQELTSPGVRVIAPSAWNFGHDSEGDQTYYFGYLDVRSNRGAVYSSSEADVTLGDLVQAATKSTPPAPGMAQIVRDGTSGIRVPWSGDSQASLMPGDLVVFGGGVREGAPQRVSSEYVTVGFVGLLGRRPIVIPLAKKSATVPDVVDLLLQKPGVAQTVRVIRTNQSLGHLRPGEHPHQLVDGDVLVFDRARMDTEALARTQTNPQKKFPPAIPLKAAHSDGAKSDQTAESKTADFSDETRHSFSPAAGNSLSLIPSAKSPSTSGPLFVEAPAPPSQDAAIAKKSAATHANGTRDSLDNDDSASGDAWELSRVAPALSPAEPSTTQKHPKPLLAAPRSPRSEAVPAPQFPKLASLVDPDDVAIDDPLLSPTSAHFELVPSAKFSPPPLPPNSVPPPTDAEPTEPVSAENQEPLAAFNTFTIAIGVLTLAGICFGVAVLWSRIDWTAQSLQQSIATGLASSEDILSGRRILERLIGNSLPVIEEQAPLPDRMDYYGEELGRRRLMLDQPHQELMGPHFAVPATAAGSQKSKQRTQSVSSGFSQRVGGEEPFGPPKRGPSVDAIDSTESPESLSPESRGENSERNSDIISTVDAAHQPSERQPHGKLLDRVLLAMERERRR